MCARACVALLFACLSCIPLCSQTTHTRHFFSVTATPTDTNPQQQPHVITVLGEVKLGTSLFSCHVCLLCHTRTHARAHTHTHTVFLCEDATRSYNTEADHEFLRPVQPRPSYSSGHVLLFCYLLLCYFCCFLLLLACCYLLLLTAPYCLRTACV